MPAAVRAYLVLYNLASGCGWALLLYRMAQHFAAAAPASRLFAAVGDLLTLLQSAALLEVVLAAVGLVRAPLATTALQVGARLLVLLGVTRLVPAAQTDWGFVVMALAWALVEVPRYSFYVAKLLMPKPPAALTWLRYSLFIFLYPPGIAGEVREILVGLPFVKAGRLASVSLPNAANFAFNYYIFLIIILILYIPGSPIMIGHMWKQRAKELGLHRTPEGKEE